MSTSPGFVWPQGLPESVYALGVYGHGVSSLTALVHARTGAPCAGSDRNHTSHPALEARLQRDGIQLFAEDGTGPRKFLEQYRLKPEQVWVLASPAVEPQTADYRAAQELGLKILSLPQAIKTFLQPALSVAVSGTSGKSTTTALTGHILSRCGSDPTIYVGAVMRATERNWRLGQTGLWVAEADESQRDFVHYQPTIGVVTNISEDHRQLSQLQADFRKFARNSEALVVGVDCPRARRLVGEQTTTFGFTAQADVGAEPETLEFSPTGSRFQLRVGGALLGTFSLPLPLRHNVSNALAALAVTLRLGVNPIAAAHALSDFPGLQRRFEVLREPERELLIVNDYAHNPPKVASALAAANLFDRRKIIVFEPHGYAPLQQLLQGLTEVLSGEQVGAEDVILVPDVYYRGGTVAQDVSAMDLVLAVQKAGRQAYAVGDREQVWPAVMEHARDGDLVILLGARDIDSVLPETVLAG